MPTKLTNLTDDLPVIVSFNAFPRSAPEVKRAEKWVITEHPTKSACWLAAKDDDSDHDVRIVRDPNRGNRYLTDADTFRTEAAVLAAFAMYCQIRYPRNL